MYHSFLGSFSQKCKDINTSFFFIDLRHLAVLGVRLTLERKRIFFLLSFVFCNIESYPFFSNALY